MIGITSTSKGLWLSNPNLAAKSYQEAVKVAMRAEAEVYQKGVVGPGGTMRRRHGKSSDTIFLGALLQDYSKPVTVTGAGSGLKSTAVSSKLPYARVLEHGHPSPKHPPPGALDKWIRSPLGLNKATVTWRGKNGKPYVADMLGNSKKARRDRKAMAFLIGRKRKERGVKGRKILATARTESQGKATATRERVLARELKARGLI